MTFTEKKFDLKKFKELEAKGLNRKEIAKELDMAPSTLHRKLRTAKEYKPIPRKNAEYVKRYKALKNSGYTESQIANELGITLSYLQSSLRECGVLIYTDRKNTRQTPPLREPYIRKLFKEGYNVRQVALILRVEEPDLKRFLKERALDASA